MILMNNSTLWFHGCSVYLLHRGIMLVSNRITKLHTFLVSVMCLKYQSSLASYGFEMTLRCQGRNSYTLIESAGFSSFWERQDALFIEFKALFSPQNKRVFFFFFYILHSVVVLASLMPLWVNLIPCLLSQHTTRPPCCPLVFYWAGQGDCRAAGTSPTGWRGQGVMARREQTETVTPVPGVFWVVWASWWVPQRYLLLEHCWGRGPEEFIPASSWPSVTLV